MACLGCEGWQKALATLMVQQKVSRFVVDARTTEGLSTMTMEVSREPGTGAFVVTLTDDARQVMQ